MPQRSRSGEGSSGGTSIKRSLSLTLSKATRSIVQMIPKKSGGGVPAEVVSLASGVSTESGIHMGSDHDTVNNFKPGRPRLILVEGESLSKILKHVKRSQSYNVCDINKENRSPLQCSLS
eukprot:sb/3476198/